MLLINAETGVSSIHGMGLFTLQDIPIGTKIWEYVPIHPQEQKDLPLVDKVNHSEDYNINFNFRACRDIKSGEEITINYKDFGLNTNFNEKNRK